MGRIKANDGQELVFGDVNKIAPLIEREVYDRVIYEILSKTQDAFFGDGFKVSFIDSNTVRIAAGVGFQHDAAQVSPEPTKRLLYRSANVDMDISAPHASNPRIDIVSVKAARVATVSESRRYKATTDSTPTTQSFEVENDWQADIVITAGTPADSPVAPATPAGYIKIAEIAVAAVSGIAGSGSITDSRAILSYGDNTRIDTSAFVGVTTKAAGTKLKTVLSELDALTAEFAPIYDAVVGSVAGCTHSTLAAAIAAVSAGARILIVSNETLNATVAVNKANLLIEAKPGVTLTNGTAGTGLSITAAGVRIRGVRFSGFTTAISIADTFNHQFVTECRFASCTTDVEDLNTTPNNVIMLNIGE